MANFYRGKLLSQGPALRAAWTILISWVRSMILKSVQQFSEKIMLNQ